MIFIFAVTRADFKKDNHIIIRTFSHFNAYGIELSYILVCWSNIDVEMTIIHDRISIQF